jgi:putative transposase
MVKALPIKLSSRQETLLQQIIRRTTNPHRLVRRAKLILAAASGESNSSISRRLELDKLASGLVARAMERRDGETSSRRRATSNGQKINGLANRKF